jgi:hypothetical protein
MIAPDWLGDGLAGLMVGVAAYCLARLVVARLRQWPIHHSVDALHVVMGVAMAGMLAPRLGFAGSGAWSAVFVATTVWFGVLVVRSGLRRGDGTALGTHVRHLVPSGAMVYMFLAAPTAAFAGEPAQQAPAISAAMASGSAGSLRAPVVGLALVAFLAASSAQLVGRLAPRAGAQPGRDPVARPAPRSLVCCQVAMNITMGYMLLTLL